MKEKINVLFVLMAILLISCGGKKEQVSSAGENAVIEKYLDEKMINPAFGGKIFSSFEVLKSTDDKIFLWAYLQEYYKDENVLKQGTGWSVPVALNTKTTNGQFEIVSHEVPSDGSDYLIDVKRIFPEDIQQVIFDFSGTESIQNLEKNSKSRADKSFK